MEKDVILIVEDNESIQFNLKLMLELNNYEVLSAINGRKALETLKSISIKPNLILSDILMPELNGYELLEELSKNSEWSTIPFIFLSAKASPDDIKLGKLLGADDYLTKPVDEELLLGLIESKIKKVRQLESGFKNKFEHEAFGQIRQVLGQSSIFFDRSSICLFVVEWDENLGPVITNRIFDSSVFHVDLESISIQLFQTTISLFGQQGIISTEAVLLNVKNIQMKALILFDSIPDQTIRGNQRQIMISVLAPEITYLNSLKLKNLLFNLSSNIKSAKIVDFDWYYEEIQSILVPV